MFKAIFLAQARFYRKAGDGSRKYVNRLLSSTSISSGTQDETDEYGFVWMKDVTLRDDAPRRAELDLTGDSDAIDFGAGPGAMVELSIFDPVADDSSLEPGGLSASPGALVEEAREVIAPSQGETNVLDFPDKDAHDLIDRWVAHFDANQTRLDRLIFVAAESQIATVLVAYLLFAVLNGFQLPFLTRSYGSTVATAATAGLALLALLAMVAAFFLARDHIRIVTHFFKTACSNSSAVIAKNIPQRQDAVISDMHSRFDALVRACLASPPDEAGLATRVNNSIRMIFRDRRRLNRTREYLRLAMRTIGMSHLARSSEDRMACIGWSWQAGNLALGLVPRIGVWIGLLIAFAVAALVPIALPVIPLLHAPAIWSDPKVGCAAVQAATGLVLFFVALGLILAAHARIMHPPVSPDDIRQIAREEALRQVKGAREAQVTSRFVDLLVLLLFRLRKEEDRQH